MNRKIFVMLSAMLFVFCALSACSTAKKPENEATSTTVASTSEQTTSINAENTQPTSDAETSISEREITSSSTTNTLTTENTTTAYSTTTQTTAQVLLPEEMAKLPDYPSYYFVWALDEEGIENAAEAPETIEYFTYDGKPVTVFCQLFNASSKAWEFGLFVEVDGILQKTEIDGQTGEIHRLELKPLESSTVKMTFLPNVGEKGEIRSLSCAVLVSPSYIAQEDDDYGIYLEPGISGNFPLVMYADSTQNADITDDSTLYKVSSVNRTIYSVYEESNNLEIFECYPFCYIYEDIGSYISKESGSFVRKTKITAKASPDSRLIINLHGKPGTYRVSLYLNGERVNAFDGKGYLDVKIGEKQQAEIPVIIDTRKLKGANRIEAYYKELNCDFTQENSLIFSSGPQKYIVK